MQFGCPMNVRTHSFKTALGQVLLSISGSGICILEFANPRTLARPESKLLSPETNGIRGIALDQDTLKKIEDCVQQCLAGSWVPSPLPLDTCGTPFQKDVWSYLQTIPCGETRSYGDIAKAIGRRNAVRAVASACAKNSIALLIPCHRVIRSDGSLGGYRWGIDRKRVLLAAENSLPNTE